MDTPAFPARWKISAPELIAETFSSCIWKGFREDGSPAIVKALKPFDDVADELRGEHYLDWRRGEGAVRLLGRDGHSICCSNMLVKPFRSGFSTNRVTLRRPQLRWR